MKKILLTLVAGSIATVSFGQIAFWKVAPAFDSVTERPNDLLEVKVEGKTGLYTTKGREFLAAKQDSVGHFSDGKALLFDNNRFIGFVDSRGDFIDLKNTPYSLVPDAQFFSCGYLLVKKGSEYFFMNQTGGTASGPYVQGYPFFDGYAAVKEYVDKEKKPNESFNTYIGTDQKRVKIPEFDKAEDLTFISSFRDNRAVCIYKKKAYYLSTDLAVTPMSTTEEVTKKSIITFDGKMMSPVATEDGFLIYGKNATLFFNRQMQLERVESEGETLYSYVPEAEAPKVVNSEFNLIGNAGKYGIEFNGQLLLPQQFEDATLLDGRYALIKVDGKWGILTVDPLSQFVFRLNNNEHIGFNHRYFTAKLAAMMPSFIKCGNATILSKSPDCEIQVESRNQIENIERNTLTYDCRLSIPPTLADTLSTQEYTYALKYDGILSTDYKVSIPEWYVKYYEVELSNNKFTVNANDTINVEFDLVKTDAARNDDTNYFKTVELLTSDKEGIPLNKITENHYSFRVGTGNRDRLAFVVRITETDCPSIEYPFVMVFQKPAPKSKNKSVNVVVNPVNNHRDITDEIYVPKI